MEKTYKIENRFTELDVILITNGDLIVKDEETPLKTLTDMCDRGFAVMDFEQVDPNMGTWEDITNLKSDFRLMFDAVFNHISSYSGWFQEFLNQTSDYVNFFESFESEDAITPQKKKLITRPRTSDVLTPYSTLNGRKYVWTTFSADQIDLN